MKKAISLTLCALMLLSTLLLFGCGEATDNGGAEGEPLKLEHNDIKWITPREIPDYDFCPADEEILKRIIERYGKTV